MTRFVVFRNAFQSLVDAVDEALGVGTKALMGEAHGVASRERLKRLWQVLRPRHGGAYETKIAPHHNRSARAVVAKHPKDPKSIGTTAFMIFWLGTFCELRTLANNLDVRRIAVGISFKCYVTDTYEEDHDPLGRSSDRHSRK